jgi:hypothetical protein
MKRENTVKCNIKVKWRKITNLEITEPDYVAKNGVDIWTFGEQTLGKGIYDDEIGVKEWTRCCSAGKKKE